MITRVDPQANLSKGKFEITNGDFQPGLIIIDQQWWQDNEHAIHEWMATNLPRGIHHIFGMIISFETDRDRMSFLLRWA